MSLDFCYELSVKLQSFSSLVLAAIFYPFHRRVVVVSWQFKLRHLKFEIAKAIHRFPSLFLLSGLLTFCDLDPAAKQVCYDLQLLNNLLVHPGILAW